MKRVTRCAVWHSLAVALLATYARSDDDLATAVVQGMKDSRERLQQGIYRASGRWKRQEGKSHPAQNDFELFCAFDFGKELLRFDHRGRVILPRPNASKDAHTKLIRDPEKEIIWTTPDHPVDVRYTKHGKTEDYPGECRPFDVRSIGFGSVIEVWSFLKPFSELFAVRTKSGVRTTTREGHGVIRLNYEFKDERGDDHRATFWVREDQGFVPIRYEYQVLAYHDSCEVTWVQLGDAWVPASCALESHWPIDNRETLHLTLDWESVNKPVPGTLFELAGLELDGDLVVTDYRVTPPVQLGKVRDVAGVEVWESPASKSWRGKWWGGLLIGAAAICVLLVAAWIRRRRSVAA